MPNEVGSWIVACTPQGDFIKWGLDGDTEFPFPPEQEEQAVAEARRMARSKTHRRDRFYLLNVFDNGQARQSEIEQAGRTTREDALRRWPCLIGHMIATSLGYFSPTAAAGALAAYRNNETYACEWYSHICSCHGRGFFNQETLLKIGRDVIKQAFEQRRDHSGYMAEYARAKQLVQAERKKAGVTSGMLASWF